MIRRLVAAALAIGIAVSTVAARLQPDAPPRRPVASKSPSDSVLAPVRRLPPAAPGARNYPPLGPGRSRRAKSSDARKAKARDARRGARTDVTRERATLREPATPRDVMPPARGNVAGRRGGSRIPPAFARFTPAELPENAPIETVGGQDWIAAHDLARLLGATKFWRPEVRKLELRSPALRILLTDDNPFVLIGDRTVALDTPVRSRGGQLRVPVALVDSLPRDSAGVRLAIDVHRRRVLRVPELGLVRTPRIASDGTTERVVFPADRPAEVSVIGRGRSHFRVRFGGLFVGQPPDSAMRPGLVLAIVPIATTEGSAFEFTLAPETEGYRIERDERRGTVTVRFERHAGPGDERFAPSGPPGARAVRVVVLDPGHGGGDAGVSVSGAIEKDLALSLAREVSRALEGRMRRVRVILTRTEDRMVSVQERAERANRAHADIVVSLHFDGAPGPAAHGATAYVPPATYGGAEPVARGAAPVALLPWRDVATRHAVNSRVLAESVMSSLELRGLGPARLREALPYPLLGVNAPGLMLECGTLTSESDRARVMAAGGLRQLADAIAAGIEAYGGAE